MSQRLGDLLVAEKLLTPSQLEEAIEAQCLYGGRLGTNIVELDFLSEDEIAKTLSRKLHLPYIEPKLLMKIPPEVIELVPQKLAWKHLVIPCRLERKRLYLAMSDPTNLTIIDTLAFRLGYIIVPVVVSEIRLMLALQKYYQLELSVRFQRLSQKLATRSRKNNLIPPAGKQVKEEPIPEVATEDILPNDAQHEENWPLLGEDESFDTLSDEEYQDLINMPAHLRIGPDSSPSKSETVPQATLEVEKLQIQEQKPFARFCQQLIAAENRDDIADALIDHIAPLSGGVALLMIKEGEALGWKGAYAGEPLLNFEQLHIPLNQPSILQSVAKNKSYYLGPLPRVHNNSRLANCFSPQAPACVLLLPLLLLGRLVCVLYLQDIDGDIEEQLPRYQKLMTKVAMAFEILILKNKIAMG